MPNLYLELYASLNVGGAMAFGVVKTASNWFACEYMAEENARACIVWGKLACDLACYNTTHVKCSCRTHCCNITYMGRVVHGQPENVDKRYVRLIIFVCVCVH